MLLLAAQLHQSFLEVCDLLPRVADSRLSSSDDIRVCCHSPHLLEPIHIPLLSLKPRHDLDNLFLRWVLPMGIRMSARDSTGTSGCPLTAILAQFRYEARVK